MLSLTRSFVFINAMVLSTIAFSFPSHAKKNLEVSSLFSDHMVLQQHDKVNFWGRSYPGQKVIITAGWGASASAIANADGKWKIKLATPKAGGPYKIRIKNTDTAIIINDVLVGEVWLASGQSNMDIPLKGWPPGDTILNSKQEISNANYPRIRFLKVHFNISASPIDSIRGNWAAITPETAGDFSATAYFYARKLQQELNVPIGIIQSSIGGTPAEAWTSKNYLLKIGDFNKAIDGLDTLQKATDSWFKTWPVQQVPKTNEQWNTINFADDKASGVKIDDSAWATIKLPGRFDLINSTDIDGAVWLRKDFDIEDPNANYVLKIGSVDDMDAIYINGTYVGGLVGEGYANSARVIKIPAALLVKGKNIIAIRAIDTGGQGLVRGPITITDDKSDTTRLEGEWRSRLVAELINGRFYTYGLWANLKARPDISRFNSNSPTVLFNAMINPLIPYTIKGVIWYQGESNVGRAEQYKYLFPNMIEDWRNKWGYILPFYYVQIAPFLYTAPDQKEQSQKLRDAQRYALKLPETGMVTTLDIGYLKTAHPPYKQEVGNRLARFALSNNYGKQLVASGPLYDKAVVAGNKIIVEFTSTGSGLVASAAGLNNFEIAGADKIYVKAQAIIANNMVEVSSPNITAPVYVRYAWSDSSSASLFNKEGLPASTFTSEK